MTSLTDGLQGLDAAFFIGFEEGSWTNNEQRLLTFCMNMRAERNGSRTKERQSTNTPNETVENSKCDMQSSTDRTRVRASPFQKHRERTISHAQRPAVDNISCLLNSKQPKAGVSQRLSGLFDPADRWMGSRNVGWRLTIVFWRNDKTQVIQQVCLFDTSS